MSHACLLKIRTVDSCNQFLSLTTSHKMCSDILPHRLPGYLSFRYEMFDPFKHQNSVSLVDVYNNEIWKDMFEEDVIEQVTYTPVLLLANFLLFLP